MASCTLRVVDTERTHHCLHGHSLDYHGVNTRGRCKACMRYWTRRSTARKRGKSYIPLNSSPVPALRHLRKAAGFTQVELSRKGGVSLTIIADAEREGKPISLASRRSLARALGVRPGELVLRKL